MGQCFSVNNHEIDDSLSNSKLNNSNLEQDSLQQTVEKGQKIGYKQKYKSQLLNNNIREQVIYEEESHMVKSSYQSSAFQDDIFNQQKSFQKRFTVSSEILLTSQFGEYIKSSQTVMIQNVATGRYLHSHALKYDSGSKQHEVSACLGKDSINDFDFWEILCDRSGNINDRDIVIINHKLTKCNISSSKLYKTKKSKLQQVCCVNSLTDLQPEDYWKIELQGDNNNQLRVNSVIKFRHIQTDGTLQVSKSRGIVNDHLEIIVANNQDNNRDNWIITTI